MKLVWVICDHYEKRLAYENDFIWPVIVVVIGLRCFWYYGIGASTIYAYTQMSFAKIPGTCKYNSTSNFITLLQIIDVIDIVNSWYTLYIFRWVNTYYVILKQIKCIHIQYPSLYVLYIAISSNYIDYYINLFSVKYNMIIKSNYKIILVLYIELLYSYYLVYTILIISYCFAYYWVL